MNPTDLLTLAGDAWRILKRIKGALEAQGMTPEQFWQSVNAEEARLARFELDVARATDAGFDTSDEETKP